MSAEKRKPGWRRWREAVFATCTAWLVLQNMVLLAVLAWGRPSEALAAGATLARTAVTWGGALLGVCLLAGGGLALAAWLVHAPGLDSRGARTEVGDGR